jgi:hypothetical protein
MSRRRPARAVCETLRRAHPLVPERRRGDDARVAAAPSLEFSERQADERLPQPHAVRDEHAPEPRQDGPRPQHRLGLVGQQPRDRRDVRCRLLQRLDESGQHEAGGLRGVRPTRAGQRREQGVSDARQRLRTERRR